MANDRQQEVADHSDQRMEKCQYAPEWAEHARNFMDSDACDDGRQGVNCGSREDESSCSL